MASDQTTITRRALSALEKVFAAEVEDRLPFQSRAKVYSELCADGLVKSMQRIYGGRFPVTVSGYQLTHAGRIIYCESCRGQEDE